MGFWHDRYTCRGGDRLEAVRECRKTVAVSIDLIDASLVATIASPIRKRPFGQKGCAPHYNDKLRNKFPMWWSGDALFRFRSSLGGS